MIGGAVVVAGTQVDAPAERAGAVAALVVVAARRAEATAGVIRGTRGGWRTFGGARDEMARQAYSAVELALACAADADGRGHARSFSIADVAITAVGAPLAARLAHRRKALQIRVAVVGSRARLAEAGGARARAQRKARQRHGEPPERASRRSADCERRTANHDHVARATRRRSRGREYI